MNTCPIKDCITCRIADIEWIHHLDGALALLQTPPKTHTLKPRGKCRRKPTR